MRELMYPYSSMKLQESDKTKIQEYIKASKIFDVSHMIIFTSTSQHNYMRFIKLPEGPTVTFKIVSYCDRADVLNAQMRKKSFNTQFISPILIMNGFNSEIVAENVRNLPGKHHYQIVSQMIQSMFPPLNLKKIKLKTI